MAYFIPCSIGAGTHAEASDGRADFGATYRPRTMITAIFALPVVALAAWLGYRAGKRRMARDAVIVMRLVQDGEAHVTEDGTVRMADSDYVEDQREVAVWQ